MSLFVGLAATTLNVVVATVIGGVTGFVGGKLDHLVQRFVDAWMAFPGLLLLLTIMSIVGQGLPQIVLVLGISGGVGGSRLVRGAVIDIKEDAYFQAVEVIGLPYIDQLRRVIMPEQATFLAALRSGKHDIIGIPGDTQLGDIGQVEALKRTNPEITLYPWYLRSGTSVTFNLRRESLFNDIRVRQAMQMAIDLETINETYYKGFAKWQPQGMIGDSLTGFHVPFEEWPEEVKKGYMYDPEGAESSWMRLGIRAARMAFDSRPSLTTFGERM